MPSNRDRNVVEDSTFNKRIITVDKTRVNEYDKSDACQHKNKTKRSENVFNRFDLW